jgi:2-dehydro-3-deoxyphosphogluconate aldolase / (4S)-4-hydroxy-2-oxoglutarate aldolase
MSKTITITKAIIEQGLLPLYYVESDQISIEILKALYRAGVRVVEYTNRGEAALANFKQLLQVRDVELPNLLIGIGTIKNMATAKKYLDVGADFLISPGLLPELAEYAVQNDICYIPGCMTVTEIQSAENLGVSFIKLFPGNLLNPEFVKSIKDIFPELLFMPTGGVDATEANLQSWFNAGVCAVGMGSKLISKDLVENKDYKAIEKNTKELLHKIKESSKK